MTPDGKTFDPETVTDKQLVQYEQAIDRGLTEADAMRLTEHEYNGFQANAIIAAALNPAVGKDVLDALATPKYTAAQMTAIAKIAIRGGDFARFLDPQMDARRITDEVMVSEGYDKQVTDTPAYDETVIDKLVCTTCGATKDAPQATSDAAK